MSKNEGIDRLPPQNIEAEEAVLGFDVLRW
jgi:hypothetical protein